MDFGCNKFIFFVEKVSEIHRFLLWEKAKNCNLSPIQIQILIFLSTTQSSQRNTSYMASFFNVTAATISESIRNLIEKGYVKSKKCTNDKRKHCFNITPRGKKLISQICDWHNPLVEIYKQKLSSDEKELLDKILYQLLYYFSEEKLLHDMTFCLDCKYFVKEGEDQFYCAHYNKELKYSDLVFNCKHFRKKVIRK